MYTGGYHSIDKPTLLLDCLNSHAIVVGPKEQKFGANQEYENCLISSLKQFMITNELKYLQGINSSYTIQNDNLIRYSG